MLSSALLFAAASLAAGFLALLCLSLIDRPRAASPKATAAGALDPTIFLFEGHDLIDATLPARRLLLSLGGADSDWDRLMAYLAPRFPTLAEDVESVMANEEIYLTSDRENDLRLRIEGTGAGLRFAIEDLAQEGQAVLLDSLSVRAQEQELGDLRETLGELAMPIWRTTPDGEVVWANRGYLDIVEATHGPVSVWPLPQVFGVDASPHGAATRRLSLPHPVAPLGRWFDCHSTDLPGGRLHVALPADALVRTEGSLKEFVQTLSKTFAHLSVGLAIFDRERRLALFNPALTDLSTLQIDFLSGRPSLHSFLDRLREARILPEPKDYASWRRQITELESAAAAGAYEETWTLATGQTYRVTGRPHPDGALAFLIEDISAEVSLTRRFRSEIQLGQSVIDALDEALCVFSHTGDLIMSNRAFASLWDLDPSATLGTVNIFEALRHWQARTLPNPVWTELRDFVLSPQDRSAWSAEIERADGAGPVLCTISPAGGGGTLVRFAAQAHRPDEAPRERVKSVRHSRRLNLGLPQGGNSLDGQTGDVAFDG